MNETTQQPVAKPKRQLTEAQKAALKKGRERLAEKRRAALENTMTELVEDTQKEETNELIEGPPPLTEEIDSETISPESLESICLGMAIVLASYFMTFIVVQQL